MYPTVVVHDELADRFIEKLLMPNCNKLNLSQYITANTYTEFMFINTESSPIITCIDLNDVYTLPNNNVFLNSIYYDVKHKYKNQLIIEPYLDYYNDVHLSTFTYEQTIHPYKIKNRMPRFVIWPYESRHKVLLNASHIVFVNAKENCKDNLVIDMVCNWILQIYNNNNYASIIMNVAPQAKRIIVFDLDNTLINNDKYDELLPHAIQMLKFVRQHFDYMILWSHGEINHVLEQSTLNNLNEFFNYGIARRDYSLMCPPKNLLHIYNLICNNNEWSNHIYFEEAILVDDTLTNFTPEYTHFILMNDLEKGIIHVKHIINNIVNKRK